MIINSFLHRHLPRCALQPGYPSTPAIGHPDPVKIHLDTDLGSDTDDACALAMLLGWPGVELVGITTAIDPGGIRAGFVHRVLELAGRTDIPVAAGEPVSLTTRITPGGIPTDARYWP